MFVQLRKHLPPYSLYVSTEIFATVYGVRASQMYLGAETNHRWGPRPDQATLETVVLPEEAEMVA